VANKNQVNELVGFLVISIQFAVPKAQHPTHRTPDDEKATRKRTVLARICCTREEADPTLEKFVKFNRIDKGHLKAEWTFSEEIDVI
jgi:hypothetical protein